jgi:hypothetical protein
MNTTWNILQPATKLLFLCLLAGFVISNTGCASNKTYEAPKMGAEYRFDDGLRAEKHPDHLFDKKTRKEMEKMGYPTGQSNAAVGAASLSGKHFTKDSSVTSTGKDSAYQTPASDTVFKVLPH